jgi:hypothetical protein
MSKVGYVLRLWKVALIAMAVSLTTLTGTASAAVAGLQLVSAESPINSTGAKSITVSCPAGKKVIGAGGQINIAASGAAALDEITPLPNLSGVNVVGVETGAGTASNWSVKAYAICANSAAIAGLQLVSVESPINSTAAKSATVSCPAGKKVIGAGGQINTAASGRVALDEITPLPNLSGVNVVGVETGGGTAGNWSVKAYAICGNSALAGLQLIGAEGPINSTAAKSATVSCPAGKKVIGAGGQINTAASGQVVLDEITPLPNLSGVTAVGVETGAGTGGNWSVKAYVICATP